jgi:hypothetical protein
MTHFDSTAAVEEKGRRGETRKGDGESDWTAGIRACMSAKHEKALAT